jgi:hypothetical protein
MSNFEFFFSFFGLLAGLTVAEVVTKFADAIDAHKRRPIGWLTPLLALFILLDISSLWIYAWSARDLITVSWRNLLLALFVSVTYFLTASLLFPRSEGEWRTLDEHFWARRKLVIGGILLIAVTILGLQFARAFPAWDDLWFWVWQGTYFVPLLMASFSRNYRVVLGSLLAASGFLFLVFTDLLPGSQWAKAVDIASTAMPE